MPDPSRPTWNTRKPLRIAVLGTLLLLGGTLVWATRAEIAGAAIGTGVIEVSSVRTAVQHPIGGVVVEIFKRDGDSVQAGDVILRLDDGNLLSELTVTESALFETLANIARLEAAIEGRHDMVLHPLLDEAVAANPQWRDLLARLQAQLDDHFTAIDTEMRLLDEQVAQIRAQIDGIDAQSKAAEGELVLVRDELERTNGLAAQGLVRAAEVTRLETTVIELEGDLGRFRAERAGLRGKIAETEVRRLKVRTDAAALISTELSKLRPERSKLLETRTRILADLARLQIRAPVSGRIIGSQVNGMRSVVVAASPLMSIVPDDEPVVGRLKVAATDVDQVFVGQEAALKFTAFNGRQTPVILGRVTQISADSFLDTRTQRFYYDVLVSLQPSEIAKLGDHDLIPGMPIEAHMATETRTPLSYVMRPILVFFDRAFRDT